MSKKLLTIGVTGSIAAGLCCVTPVLPWLLSNVGLSGIIGYVYRDAVLLPLLAVFLIMTGIALWRLRQPR